ncbi:ATP-dependent helicase [Candidatus Uhrbacteria bacterium]|nr:ATP-dependent helicase [Candidatus Uhrbacteria bacterium]
MGIDFKNELNEQQLEVVLKGNGPTLVLAGAGSGKTRTIIYRVAYLLEQGVDPSSILLVTFTNKAAKEIKERLEHLLGSPPGSLWAGTFHSISNRLLRQYGGLLGYEQNYTILDQDDSKSFIKICIKEAGIKSSQRRFPSPKVLQSIISYSRNAALSIPETIDAKFQNFSDLESDIVGIATLYRQKKLDANAMDFDDLLLKFHDLLAEHGDVEDRLSTKFKYILVDEYQDTNALQANIVTRLAKVHRNILVVGDDAQSIYSFRAANIQNILRFPMLFENSSTYRLEVNYRSTPEILQLANDSIVNNTEQFEKTLRPDCGHGDKPTLAASASPREEASYIVDKMMALLDGDTRPEDIAVLFRAAYHSQALEFELMRRGLAYEYRGGMRFFERAHIKDALAFIRLLENQKDDSAWLRILSMCVGVGPATAVKIIATVKGLTHEEMFSDDILSSMSKRAGEGWRQAREMLEKVFSKDGLSSQIRAVVTTTYMDYLENEYTNPTDRLQDLDQLALFAEQYEANRGQFLEDVTLSDEFGAIMNANQAFRARQIVLSTIHQAKGLEWKVVFVVSLTNGAFPIRKAMDSEEDVQEERRLFYVAVTRAKQYLHLTYPMTGLGENYTGLSPSMFLEELPHGTFESLGQTRRELPPTSVFAPTFDDGEQGGFHNDESHSYL